MLEALETGFGLDLVAWLNDPGGVLWYLFAPLAFIGSELGIMAVLAVVYWAVDERVGRRLFVLVLGSQILSTVAKISFARPRPFSVAPERISPLGEPEGFGLPSGHTIFGTISGLWLIETARRRWVTAAAIAYIVLMGLSRMVHGVHYLHDVVAGWALGLAFYGAYRAIEGWTARRGLRPLWSVSLSLSIPVILSTVAVLFVATILIQGDFEERKSVFSVVGGLAGALFGLVGDTRRLRFSAEGPVSSRLLRLAVGLPLLGGLHFGLSAVYYLVIGESAGVGALVLYLVRYGLVGAAAALGLPALFRGFGLAPMRREGA